MTVTKSALIGIAVIVGMILIYQYNPGGLFESISSNIDYWQFTVLAALGGITIYQLAIKTKR